MGKEIPQFMDSPISVYNDKRGGCIIQQGQQIVICDAGSITELISELQKVKAEIDIEYDSRYTPTPP